MGIVEDAVSYVKSMVSKLKSDSSGMFTVRASHTNHCNSWLFMALQ